MTTPTLDTRQLNEFGRELITIAGGAMTRQVIAHVDNTARQITALARAHAKETAGRHGRYYPLSIGWDRTLSFGSIGAEIGPDASMRQGGMSFEYGSTRQPAHLDVNRAADVHENRFTAGLAAIAMGAFNA